MTLREKIEAIEQAAEAPDREAAGVVGGMESPDRRELPSAAADPAALDVEALAEAMWTVCGWPNQPGNKPLELFNWDRDNPSWEAAAEQIAAEYARLAVDAILAEPSE